MLRQQTRGNRLYFSSFPVPVLDDPTYVGPEGIPRVLGAGGAAALARKIPSWRWGALPIRPSVSPICMCLPHLLRRWWPEGGSHSGAEGRELWEVNMWDRPPGTLKSRPAPQPEPRYQIGADRVRREEEVGSEMAAQGCGELLPGPPVRTVV